MSRRLAIADRRPVHRLSLAPLPGSATATRTPRRAAGRMELGYHQSDTCHILAQRLPAAMREWTHVVDLTADAARIARPAVDPVTMFWNRWVIPCLLQ